VYTERFADLSNGLCGDMSAGKDWHTNYRRGDLVHLLRQHGLEPVRVEGANLFWRWFQVPGLLASGRLRALCEYAVYLDAKLFRSANVFITAEKVS
jgi:hypothetical protein